MRLNISPLKWQPSLSGSSRFRIAAACAPIALCLVSGALGSAFPVVLAATVSALPIFFRPSRIQPTWLVWVWLGLAIVPLAALLPSATFGLAAWRMELSTNYGLPLAPTVTPDPTTLRSILVLYWCGLAYLWWNCSQHRNAVEATVLVRAAIGITAVLAVFTIGSSPEVPGFLAAGNASPMTRNQLATILAIGVAMGIATALPTPSRRWISAAPEIGVVILCTVALASLGSRAGLALAGVGAATVLLVVGILRRSMLHAALAFVVPMVGIATLPFLPGESAARIRETTNPLADYRFTVQADAFELVADHPLTGVGFGSFESVFPFYQRASRPAIRARHSENDLLMLAAESGPGAALLAMAAAIGLAVSWSRNVRQDRAFTEPASAAFGTLAIFALHGLVDVPGHSLLVMFFVAAIAGVACRTLLMGTGSSKFLSIVPGMALLGLAIIAFLIPGPQRPAELAHDRSINDIPTRRAIDSWLAAHPLDAGIVELRAHRSILDDRFVDASRDFDLLDLLAPSDLQISERAVYAWQRERRPQEFVKGVVRFLDRLPEDQLPNRLSGLGRTAENWPAAASEFARLNPPLTWMLDRRTISPKERAVLPARVAIALGRAGRSDVACQIVIFQIGPGLGEHLPDSEIPGLPRLPFTFSGESDDVSDSWYDVAVHRYFSGKPEAAWNILQTYLAVKLHLQQ